MVALAKPYLTYNYNKIPVSKDNRPYRALGGALEAWRSGRRECLLAGPAGTGKSRAIIQKLHFCAQKYPNMRAIICRKTRKSITQSAMVTYEKKVLPPGWLDKYVHFSTVDQQYEYVNGSVIAVAGLDDPTKVMSSEWDIIYVQEATELSEEDWQALITRLRNNLMPYQQLIADCNPSYPTHWLKQRCDRKETQMIPSKHTDNPSLTPEYLTSLRETLHGVMKLRLYDGIWAAAEGLVYDEWNPAVHVATKKQLIEWDVLNPDGTVNKSKIRRFIAGVDWGYVNPGVINIFGIDNDDRMYLLREVYRTQRRIDWWVEQAKELHQEFGIDAWICDPSEPSFIDNFRSSGLRAIGAVNDITPGIEAAKKRLAMRKDNTAGFYVYEYSLKERDEDLAARHLPLCFENEINAYSWPKQKDGQAIKEVPIKLNDHSCLVAGTMISTDHGDVPIERIRIGDRVLTRDGYMPVKAAGMTNLNAEVFTVRFSNGKTLTGTANHPVYLKGKGYIDLHALRYGDIIETPNTCVKERSLLCEDLVLKSLRQSFTKVSPLDVTQTLKVPQHETIIQPMQGIDAMVFKDYIRKFGKMSMGLFQKAMTSTTGMAIRLTMLWKTLNAFRNLNTLLTISQLKLKNAKQQKKNILREYDRLQLLGTDLRKAARGLEGLLEKHGRKPNLSHANALIVEKNFKRLLLELRRSTAPIIANRQPVSSQVSTMLKPTVDSVVKSSHTINTKSRSFARKNATEYPTTKAQSQNLESALYARKPSQQREAVNRNTVQQGAQVVAVSSISKNDVAQDVYNITVDNTVGEGEYFANGILVHNCDNFRYVCKFTDRPQATTSYKSPWR